MTTTLRFDVRGMTCDHCVHAVTNAVSEVPGVREVTVALATNSATVQADNVDVKKIIEAIEEEGYEAALKPD